MIAARKRTAVDRAAVRDGDGPDVATGGLSWTIEFGEPGGPSHLRDFELLWGIKA